MLNTNLHRIAGGALASLALTTAACTGANSHGGAQESEDRRDFFTAAELVNASDAIVVGRVQAERDESFEFRSQSTGAAVAGLTEHVLTVQVTAVLKGDVRLGETIAVMQTAQNSELDRVNGDVRVSREVLALEKEDEYVFFLSPVVMPPEFSGKESSTWGRPGEPGFARLDGNVLRFVSTARYREAVEARGLQLADDGAPFGLNLSAVESLVASQ